MSTDKTFEEWCEFAASAGLTRDDVHTIAHHGTWLAGWLAGRKAMLEEMVSVAEDSIEQLDLEPAHSVGAFHVLKALKSHFGAAP